jgi:heme exporter protein D
MCWKQKMLIDVKKEKKRESRASKALYVQTAVKGRGRR